MSTTWLSTLGVALKNWNLVNLEPQTSVKAGDHVVGTADSELKKLYELSIQHEKSGFESFVAAQHAKTKENGEYHIKKAIEFHRKHEILMEFFWTSIRDTFDLWDKSSIGIRKGWKIVWDDDKEPEPEPEQHKIVVMSAMCMN